MKSSKDNVFLEKSREAGELERSVGHLDKEEKSQSDTTVIPLMESIKTMSFVLHMIWLINVYMLRFYITSFNTWAWKTTNDASQGVRIFHIILEKL